jgi:hypothetical protein
VSARSRVIEANRRGTWTIKAVIGKVGNRTHFSFALRSDAKRM